MMIFLKTTVLLLFLSQLYIAYSERRKYWTTSICWDESKIQQVYKHMIDAARRDVYGPILTALIDYFSLFQAAVTDDLGFYKVYFGITKIILTENLEKLNSITYHRIFKNGNDNIRYLLYRFVNSLHVKTNTSAIQSTEEEIGLTTKVLMSCLAASFLGYQMICMYVCMYTGALRLE